MDILETVKVRLESGLLLRLCGRTLRLFNAAYLLNLPISAHPFDLLIYRLPEEGQVFPAAGEPRR